LFNDGLIDEITLTALGVRWGWEIRKPSKPAKYNDEGDTAGKAVRKRGGSEGVFKDLLKGKHR